MLCKVGTVLECGQLILTQFGRVGVAHFVVCTLFVCLVVVCLFLFFCSFAFLPVCLFGFVTTRDRHRGFSFNFLVVNEFMDFAYSGKCGKVLQFIWM